MANEFVTRRGIISLGGVTFPYYSTTTVYTETKGELLKIVPTVVIKKLKAKDLEKLQVHLNGLRATV